VRLGRIAFLVLLVAAVPLAGCTRRQWNWRAQPDFESGGAPTAAEAAASLAPVVSMEPTSPSALSTAPMPEQATQAEPQLQLTLVPLDPLWDELDAALADLESSLSGLEDWDVDVP
jgi:hypothetical protein